MEIEVDRRSFLKTAAAVDRCAREKDQDVGNWQPFREGKIQQLLTPARTGSGQRDALVRAASPLPQR
jgi:hypothetical protein